MGRLTNLPTTFIQVRLHCAMPCGNENSDGLPRPHHLELHASAPYGTGARGRSIGDCLAELPRRFEIQQRRNHIRTQLERPNSRWWKSSGPICHGCLSNPARTFCTLLAVLEEAGSTENEEPLP
jgi:hypothetical protein